MNSYTISLSSNTLSTMNISDEISFYDLTTLTINLSGITEEKYPLFLKIDWGDGNSEFHDNTIFKNYRKSSIIPEILYSKFSSVLKSYEHVYKPSETHLYKQLSAQVYIEYGTQQYNWFIIPIQIRNNGYFDAVGGLKLINTNLLPTENNNKQYQFLTDEGGFLIEIQK